MTYVSPTVHTGKHQVAAGGPARPAAAVSKWRQILGGNSQTGSKRRANRNGNVIAAKRARAVAAVRPVPMAPSVPQPPSGANTSRSLAAGGKLKV